MNRPNIQQEVLREIIEDALDAAVDLGALNSTDFAEIEQAESNYNAAVEKLYRALSLKPEEVSRMERRLRKAWKCYS